MTPKLMRWSGPAMVLGGLLWVLSYGVNTAFGLTLGEPPGPEALNSAVGWISALALTGGATFGGALLFLGIGLFGLGVRLARRSKKLGIAALPLASVAVAAAAVQLSLLTGIPGDVRSMGGLVALGIFSLFGGAILLGIAALRSRMLPRWAGVSLVATGALFVPLIFATIPLEAVLPSYASHFVADLPFLVSGIVLAAVGRALLSERGSAVKPEPAVR